MTTDTAQQTNGRRTSPPDTAMETARQQVGLLLGSSADFVVCMYAAWRAGLGILPLPPEFPDERLGAMLGDCAPRILLTTRQHRERAARLITGAAPETRLVLIDDTSWGEAPVVADEAVAVATSKEGQRAAFTVYTSGSTGRPKGVLVRHSNLSPLIRWFGETFEMGEGARIAQTLSLGFDFGLQELFTSLPFGASVIVPGPEDRRDARCYARFLRLREVTVLYTTPSFAEELAATGEPLPALRVVLLGGEVLTASAVQALRRVVTPQCRLFNGYGPTEATVNCLVHEIPADLLDDRLPTVLPVGAATSGSWVRVVDEQCRPLPVGAVGELLIGGNGVTDGYLGRPEQTRERFLAEPGSSDPDRQVYRSGDLGYVAPGGGFVVLGRADRQVKVRGFRVEPGEVEQVLRGCPGVETAVVRAMGKPLRLVAFAVVGGDAAELRAWVAARLPAAMVPEQIVQTDHIPLNANGKTDEATLQRLAEQDYVPRVAVGATAREVESMVRDVWGKALGAELPAGDVNVFDEGAHSLVVMQVHHRLEAALAMSFPPHYLFEHPQPQSLAERLHRDRTDTGPRSALSTVHPITAKDEL